MNNLRFIHLFSRFYNLIWKVALPFLKTRPRLKQGLSQRISADHLTKADIWIHAASAGEAYLAVEIVKHFYSDKPVKIMLSSTTLQGMEILEKKIINSHNCTGDSFFASASADSSATPFTADSSVFSSNNIICEITWFPFDMPEIMENAVSKIDPEIMVILETELWPGLFMALKKRGTGIIIINARLSNKSYKAYLKTIFLWKELAPDNILAISDKDKIRFEKIFKHSEIALMPNIKFDAICNDNNNFELKNLSSISSNALIINGLFPFLQNTVCVMPDNNHGTPSDAVISQKCPMSILVSIRREEERDTEEIITEILHRFPRQVVGLFPRHMHRIEHWKARLTQLGFPWKLRSEINDDLENGDIILWDVFGELKQIYPFAVTAFIGGSLKPLGGQNFIEPVVWGTATVTGPFINDFSWVGEDIFKNGIVKKVKTWQEVAAFMVNNLQKPCERQALGKKARLYFMKKRGGTDIACRKIKEIIDRME